MKSQTYGALHKRMRQRIAKPDLCQSCSKNPPCDLANISGEYKDDISDWEWLCRGCHMTKDGRILELQKYKPKGERNHFWKGGKKIELTCICGKEFYKYESRIKNADMNFCSGSCRNRLYNIGKGKGNKGYQNLANCNFL